MTEFLVAIKYVFLNEEILVTRQTLKKEKIFRGVKGSQNSEIKNEVKKEEFKEVVDLEKQEQKRSNLKTISTLGRFKIFICFNKIFIFI
jgi:hypothetical protein